MVLSGLTLVALVAILPVACWHGGAAYYFPAWTTREWLFSDENRFAARQRELDSAADRVDILFEVTLREPPRLAATADVLRDKLPTWLGHLIPEYVDQRDAALGKIAENVDRDEFVAATLRMWPRWKSETRQMWLGAVDRSIGGRPEYRGLLEASLTDPDPILASMAVRRLGDYKPFPAAAVGRLAPLILRIAGTTNAFWHRAAANLVLAGVAEHAELPEEVIVALGRFRASSQPAIVLLAELCIDGLRPGRGLNAETWMARVESLSDTEAVSFMSLLGRPEFHPAVRHPVVRDWLMRLAIEEMLSRRDPQRLGSVPPAHRAGRLLERSLVGEHSPALVGPLLTRMRSTNEAVQLRAARLFAGIAPRDPDLLVEALPILTNSAVVAPPLLLWIASMGTNARPAVPTVILIATSGVRYWRPRQLTAIDPPYIDPWTTTKPPPGERVIRLPAQIRIDPTESCPETLRTFWPGAEFQSETMTRWGSLWGDWSGFDSRRLDEIALMTLTRILPPEELAELRSGGVVQDP